MDLLESVVDASGEHPAARLGDVADGEREGVLARQRTRADEEGGPVAVAPSSLGGADDERLGVRGGILGESGSAAKLTALEMFSRWVVCSSRNILRATLRLTPAATMRPRAPPQVTAVRRPVVQERAERAILVVLDRGRERAP